MTVPGRLRIAVFAVLLASTLANVYSIAHQLPYAVGGTGSPDHVAADWSAHGTALGPPAMPMVVLLLMIPFAGSRRWWGRVTDVLGLLVALALLVGTAAEPSARAVVRPATFDAVQVLIRLGLVASAVVLGALCARHLLARNGAARKGTAPTRAGGVRSPEVATAVHGGPGPGSH
jgi:hypothetical protein